MGGRYLTLIRYECSQFYDARKSGETVTSLQGADTGLEIGPRTLRSSAAKAGGEGGLGR